MARSAMSMDIVKSISMGTSEKVAVFSSRNEWLEDISVRFNGRGFGRGFVAELEPVVPSLILEMGDRLSTVASNGDCMVS